MPYYPGHTLILGMTTIRRERKLPPNAIGEVLVEQHQTVEPATPVLRGALPGKVMLLDALKPLGLKTAEEITEDMLQVEPGEVLNAGQPILTRGKGRRARSVVAPVQSIFARLDGDRVIVQTNPAPLEVRAMIPGIITSIRGNHTVVIESSGALIQGAWGNGQAAFAQLVMEPKEGIESLQTIDELLSEEYGMAMVLPRSIDSPAIFAIAAGRSLAALIAPSMHASLREMALRQRIPIILTEGFGDLKMSEIVYNLLRGNEHRTATIDATEPTRWSPERPEIAIPMSVGGIKPPPPVMDQPLEKGALVRITRAPLFGQTGRIRRVLERPRSVENGLRLACAEVQLADEAIVSVPLANLELLGRPVDASGQE